MRAPQRCSADAGSEAEPDHQARGQARGHALVRARGSLWILPEGALAAGGAPGAFRFTS